MRTFGHGISRSATVKTLIGVDGPRRQAKAPTPTDTPPASWNRPSTGEQAGLSRPMVDHEASEAPEIVYAAQLHNKQNRSGSFAQTLTRSMAPPSVAVDSMSGVCGYSQGALVDSRLPSTSGIVTTPEADAHPWAFILGRWSKYHSVPSTSAAHQGLSLRVRASRTSARLGQRTSITTYRQCRCRRCARQVPGPGSQGVATVVDCLHR